jgi:type I restriction enzyme S subunit
MSSEWQNATMSDIVTHYRGGEAFGKLEYASSGIPVIAKGDVKQYGNVSSSFSRFISEGRWQEKRYKKTEKGDFILTTRDLTQAANFLGLLSPVPDPYDFLVNQGANIVRFHHSVDPAYLVYWSHSAQYREHIKSVAVGSTQIHLRKEDFLSAPLVLPPLQEQKAIAHILGTLDEKFELNRKTNETLEAMAKALFKSWFVDFDPVRAKAEGRPTGLPDEISDLFPDSFDDSELGEIPRGWEVGGLEEFLVLQRGFDLPAPQRIKGAYPVVAASGVSGTHNEPMAFAPGVVTGRSGVLGKVFYIQTDFFPLNTTLWAKEFRLATPIYGYFLLCDIDFAVFNAGSAVPTLNRNHLGSLRFPLPPKALVVSFTDVAVDLMKRKEVIVAETSNLSATRDALLPKLISGEIRIPDAEKMLEEVGV